MNAPVFVVGDVSGIQSFVLRVKTSGKAQAKRLRARSFLLELLEHAALWIIQQKLAVHDDDVLTRGGGGFLVRVPSSADATLLTEISVDLQRRVWSEFHGQVHFSLGWGATPMQARDVLERRKRTPGVFVLQNGARWDPEHLSRPSLDEPCEVCLESPGQQVVPDENEESLHCRNCLEARKIGEELTRREWLCAGRGPLKVLGVPFELLESKRPGASRVGRWIPRERPSGQPLTFEDLARRCEGIHRLAVLKADVDDMGLRVAEIAGADPSCRQLRSFSRDLHAFFGEQLQILMAQHWPLVYTLYAGGDDLLLVGPWNVMLDFAGALAQAFRAGPALEYAPLTFSAGIALTPYRIPIRHAVERAEESLQSAKEQPGKNRCAALAADWAWDRHGTVIADGKMMVKAVHRGGVGRGLLHRLLLLAEASEPKEREIRSARWSYQIARNVRHDAAAFRRWAHDAIGHLESDAAQRARESAASLRYALLATGTRIEET